MHTDIITAFDYFSVSTLYVIDAVKVPRMSRNEQINVMITNVLPKKAARGADRWAKFSPNLL